MPMSCWATSAALRQRSQHQVRSGGPRVASSRLSRLTPSSTPEDAPEFAVSALAKHRESVSAGDLVVSCRLDAHNLGLKRSDVVKGAFVVENDPVRVLHALVAVVVYVSPLGKVAWKSVLGGHAGIWWDPSQFGHECFVSRWCYEQAGVELSRERHVAEGPAEYEGARDHSRHHWTPRRFPQTRQGQDRGADKQRDQGR